MLSQAVILRSPLTPDECVSRLTQNTKRLPRWGGWFGWKRDPTFWGSAAGDGFRLEQGRPRQLVFASGRVADSEGGTVIDVTFNVKEGVILYMALNGVVLIGIGWLLGRAYGDLWFVATTTAIAIVVMLANLAIGLLQKRDLLSALRRVIQAR